MASPPELSDGRIESWGPAAEDHQVRVHRVVDLLAARLGLPIDVAADMLLMEVEGRHRYVLVEEIGRSSHAVVFVAIDQMLAREVALKIHLEQRDERHKWTVFKEARTQVLFDHPNVVHVFDVGEHEGLSFTVAELCDTDMGAWAPGQPWRAVLGRIVEAGRGLEALHAADVIHCDVKPANIMIKDQVAKIGDFGLSRPPGLTLDISGTPGFIAPEVAAGVRTPAADVFALAVSAWVCLFGVLPFAKPTQAELDAADSAMLLLLERAQAGRLAPEPEGTEVPAAVIGVIAAGLVPDPRWRPSLTDWLRELERTYVERERPAWVPGFAVGLVVGGVCTALALAALMSPAKAPQEARSRQAQETEVTGSAQEAPDLQLPSVYIEYERRHSEGAVRTIEETRAVAEALIAEAEGLHSASPVTLAVLARTVAGDLKVLAILARDEESQDYADSLIQRAETIISQSR